MDSYIYFSLKYYAETNRKAQDIDELLRAKVPYEFDTKLNRVIEKKVTKVGNQSFIIYFVTKYFLSQSRFLRILTYVSFTSKSYVK